MIVIGGGDTGSDCTGTSNRQGCRSLTQFELLPQPPDVGSFPRGARAPGEYALALLADDPAHQHLARRRLRSPLEHPDQGIPRRRKRATSKASSPSTSSGSPTRNGRQTIQGSRPAPSRSGPASWCCWRWAFSAREERGPIAHLGLELDPRGNVKCDANYMTSVDGVFAAGDIRRGQSLVVWAIHEGREAARAVDKYLMGVSHLPSVNAGDFAWR